MEALIEKEDAAEELRQEGKSRKVTIEADRMNAEDMRKKAMENLGETQKRKSVESGVTPAKKKRSNGSDTVNYLREKHEKMLEVEKKKLTMDEKRMEAASKRHDELMTTLQQQQQQQQQQQMETFQVMMMQQQRQMQMQQAQQNELMLKLFGMLNNK